MHAQPLSRSFAAAAKAAITSKSAIMDKAFRAIRTVDRTFATSPHIFAIPSSDDSRLRAPPGFQGEFGIGLLAFWTLGEELTLTSTGADHRAWQMIMRKGDPGYTVKAKRALFVEPGTELRITEIA